MAIPFLSPIGLPSVAVALNASSPNPGITGSLIWSTTTSSILVWDGANWVAPAAAGSGLTSPQVLARTMGS